MKERKASIANVKVYKCTDCGARTYLKDNGEVTVGYCKKCGDAGYKEGVSYGISTCNAEFHALVHDAYEKFDCLKRVGKSDVEKILSELIETSLGDDINPNMEYKKKIK